MPVCDSIAGFTKMMYAIVMNVVRPASNSFRHVVWCAAKPKYRSRRVRIGIGLLVGTMMIWDCLQHT